jgi:putative flavoprotein involved in K+ transport
VGVERAQSAHFADDGCLDDVAAVVWATGFGFDYPWLDVSGVWDGTRVLHRRGRTHIPGLWFIGLPWQHTRGSAALLGFVGTDAAWLVDQISAGTRTF